MARLAAGTLININNKSGARVGEFFEKVFDGSIKWHAAENKGAHIFAFPIWVTRFRESGADRFPLSLTTNWHPRDQFGVAGLWPGVLHICMHASSS
jgi:hypothetical protein